jgi:hypothetical protein
MRQNSFFQISEFRVIKSTDRNLQSDIDSEQKLCIENYKKINTFKTNIISLLVKLTVSISITLWAIFQSHELSV